MPQRTSENRILREFKFQAKKQLLASQPDIVVVDKEQKSGVVIDVAIPQLTVTSGSLQTPKGTHVEGEVQSGPCDSQIWRVVLTKL